MAQASAAKLYTPRILSLAVELHRYPLTDACTLRAEARSRSCGSVLEAGFALAPDGSVAQVGLRATACAIGQASAVIFAQGATGLGSSAIVQAHDAIARWLEGAGDQPDWPGLSQLENARAFPARHGAILRGWQAAKLALCNAQPDG